MNQFNRDSGFGTRDSTVRAFTVRTGSRARQASSESVEHLTDSACEIANGRDFFSGRKFHSRCQFELRFASGLRSESHDDVVPVCICPVLVSLSDVGRNTDGSAAKLRGQTE